jgi:hypothetical protein
LNTPVVEGVFEAASAVFDLAGEIFSKRSIIDKIHKQREAD